MNLEGKWQFDTRRLLLAIGFVAVLVWAITCFRNRERIWFKYVADKNAIVDAADVVFNTHEFYNSGTEKSFLLLSGNDASLPNGMRELSPRWVYLEPTHLVLMYGGGNDTGNVRVIVYMANSRQNFQRLEIH